MDILAHEPGLQGSIVGYLLSRTTDMAAVCTVGTPWLEANSETTSRSSLSYKLSTDNAWKAPEPSQAFSEP